MRKTATYFLFGLLLFGSFGLLAQTMMPIPPHASAFTANPRGFWFVAPTDFIITGLRVPTEASTAPQSVQLVRFAAVSQPGNYTTLAHFGSVPGTGILPVNEIINTGDVIGILGVRDVSTNSYGTGSFPTTILGLPVTLERLWINGQQINTAPVTNAMTLATTSQITRVEMYYTPLGPCVSPPFAGNTQANPATVCINNPTSLSVDSVTMGQGSSFQWQVSTDNVNWSNMVGDTLPIASAIVSNATQWHRLENTCGGVSTFSTPVQVFGSGTPLAAGTYTINSLSPTGGTNFTNFTDFFQAVECGGISGPIVLNVVSGTGPYVEHVRATNIGNTSAINSITINGNGEVLEFSNTDNLQRATLTLDGSSFITIDGLVIRALATGSVGYGIHLTNGANNNVIKNCQIEIPQTTTSANFAGIVSNTGTTAIAQGGNFPFENTIENNVITGGYYGVTLIGGGSANRASGNKVLNNTLHEYYFYGIYSHSQEDFEYIGNDMARPSRTTLSSFYGIFCTQEHHGGTIAKNAIHDPFGQVSSTSLIYAMYSTNASGTANKPNHVYNNIFYNLENNGTLYGIWNANSSHWKYYHNSIDIDDLNPTAGLTRAIYLSGNSDNVEFLNNVISLNRSGTSLKYAVYILGSGTRTFDNNGYFVNYTSGNTEFGYLNTGHASFSDWQTATNWDGNSVFQDPNFVFAPGGILVPNAGALDNIGQNLTAIVPTDYYDSVRTITPDPGAFEFQGPPCSNPVGFDTASVNSTSMTLSWVQPGTSVNQWDIEWGPVGFSPGTVGGNSATINTNPHTISQLTPGECYDVYIRANCTNFNQGVGPWIGPLEVCLPTEYDIAVNAILSPIRNDCGTATFPISIQIENVGTLNANNFTLHANLTGAATATLSVPFSGTLNSGMTDSIYIGDANLLFGGNVDITTYVSYSLDQDNDNDTLVQTIPVNATAPSDISTAKDSLCPGEQIWLVTPSYANRNNVWYDDNNNQVGTGDSILVGPISGPSFFKVEPVAGGSERVGARDTTIGPITNFTNLSVQSLLITVVNEVTVVEAKIYPGNAGILDIEFRPLPIGSGANITKSVAVPAPSAPGMPVVISIDMTIPAGNYQMGANTSSTVGGLLRNGSGAVFPFGSNDFIITGNTFSAGYYYYYYDIVVSTGVPCQIDADSITLYPKSDTAFATFSNDAATGAGLTISDFTVNFDATGSVGNQYTWDFGDGNTGVGLQTNHIYTNNGTYQVTFVAESTCGNDTATETITIAGISAEDLTLDSRLRVFPNPSKGAFQLELEVPDSRQLYLRVMGPSGQIVFEEDAGRVKGAFHRELNFDKLASGIYILQLQSDQGFVNRRLHIAR
jgi:parallel beta-helix repeat protein